MNEYGRFRSIIAWLCLGTFLTFALYLPVWLVIGMWLHPRTHPDYWTFNGPPHIFPIAAVVASSFVLLIRRVTGKL